MRRQFVQSTYWSLAVAFVLSVGGSGAAWAADQDQTRDQDRDLLQLRDQIHKDTNLSQQELDALDPELKQYLQQKGGGEQVRATIRTALQNNCKAECLRETVRSMNRAMSQGVTDKEARNMVESAVREQARERDQKRLAVSDQELGNQVRTRVENQLTAMEQQKTREREQAEKREMERGLGSPAPGGGPGPGGSGKGGN
ncbi:MAG: hypothetical protein AB1451_00455 [Nitrospirota bacterium]